MQTRVLILNENMHHSCSCSKEFCSTTSLLGVVLKDIRIGMGGLGFDSLTSQQIKQCVANGSPPLRCLVGDVLPRRQAAEMNLPLVTHFGVILRVGYNKEYCNSSSFSGKI